MASNQKRNPKSAAKKEKEEEEDDDDEQQDDDDDDDDDGDDDAQDAGNAGDSSKEKKVEDIRNKDVVTMYRVAADIANQALQLVVKEAKAGASIVGLCEAGDKYITDSVGKVFNKGKLSKGVGFPTCVSVNHIVGSFSPLKSDDVPLKAGDLVKVDLGVHIDGYLSMAAHTFVVSDEPVTGKQANVMAATYNAAECVLRMLRPGTSNTQITQMIEKVAKEYKCTAVESIFSHRCNKFDIDTEHMISNRAPEPTQNAENKTKEIKVDVNEVWAIDIVLSTGNGKPSPVDDRTTVYKRAIDTTYALKMKTSRAVLAEINNKFPIYPFTIRALELEEKKAKLGILECFKHQLVDAYPVVHEKDGEFVANIKFTALVLPDHTLKITGLPLDLTKLKPDFSITDDNIKTLLTTAVSKKAAKKKSAKKKKKKSAAKAGDKKPEAEAPAAKAGDKKPASPSAKPASPKGSPSAKPATPAKAAPPAAAENKSSPAPKPAKSDKASPTASPAAKPVEAAKPAEKTPKSAKKADK